MPDGDAGVREQVLTHLEKTVFALADEVQPIGIGWSARTRDLAHVWTLNQLHITAPGSVSDVVTRADEHQADLPYRHVLVDDAPTAAALERALDPGDWVVERELIMVLGPTPELTCHLGALRNGVWEPGTTPVVQSPSPSCGPTELPHRSRTSTRSPKSEAEE